MGLQNDWRVIQVKKGVIFDSIGGEKMERNILVPIDFSEINKPMVQIADEWAQRTGARLFFLHVVPDLTYRYINPDIQNVFHTNFIQLHHPPNAPRLRPHSAPFPHDPRTFSSLLYV